MGSSANINTQNIMISPCKLIYDGVDLGAVEGDVSVTVETLTSEIKVAQLGATVVDMVANGQNFTIKAKLLEVNPTMLKRLLNTSKLQSTGANLLVDNNIGAKFSQYAKTLVLHPLAKDDNDKSADVLFYKAVGKPSSELAFGNETQTGVEIEFFALPDLTTSPARFCLFGDPAVGVVNPVAAAAVPAAGNVGNGTVNNVAALSRAKTETVTAKALDPTNFQVKGADGRTLGVAVVGSLFTAEDLRIQFQINAGSTAFAANDAFTFAVVAANYA